jgi:MOSC domain-containing protein YiiM
LHNRGINEEHRPMSDRASIIALCAAPAAGAPLQTLAEAELEAGRGLVGDRYHAAVGTFSGKLQGRPDAEITLIEIEEIRRFADGEARRRDPGEFRRNIVTEGVRLDALVGRRFLVGPAVLEGIRLCEPCAHLGRLVSPMVVEAMAHRAGLRARIITGGMVRVGDAIIMDGDNP